MKKLITFVLLVIVSLCQGQPAPFIQATSTNGTIILTPPSGHGVVNFEVATNIPIAPSQLNNTYPFSQTTVLGGPVGTNGSGYGGGQLIFPWQTNLWPSPGGYMHFNGTTGNYPLMWWGCNNPMPIFDTHDLVPILGINGQFQGFAPDDVHNTIILTFQASGCDITKGWIISNDNYWTGGSNTLTVLQSSCMDAATSIGMSAPAGMWLDTNKNGGTVVQLENYNPVTALFVVSQAMEFCSSTTLASNAPTVLMHEPNGFSNVINAGTVDIAEGGLYACVAQTTQFTNGWTPTNCIEIYTSGGNYVRTINTQIPLYDCQSIAFDPYDPSGADVLYVVGSSACTNTFQQGSIFKVVVTGTNGIATDIEDLYLQGGTSGLFTGGQFVKNSTNNFVFGLPFDANAGGAFLPYMDLSDVSPGLVQMSDGTTAVRLLTPLTGAAPETFTSPGKPSLSGYGSGGWQMQLPYSDRFHVYTYSDGSYVDLIPETGFGPEISASASLSFSTSLIVRNGLGIYADHGVFTNGLTLGPTSALTVRSLSGLSTINFMQGTTFSENETQNGSVAVGDWELGNVVFNSQNGTLVAGGGILSLGVDVQGISGYGQTTDTAVACSPVLWVTNGIGNFDTTHNTGYSHSSVGCTNAMSPKKDLKFDVSTVNATVVFFYPSGVAWGTNKANLTIDDDIFELPPGGYWTNNGTVTINWSKSCP
jgi:hypothetical protein